MAETSGVHASLEEDLKEYVREVIRGIRRIGTGH